MSDYTPPNFQLISHEDVVAMEFEQTINYAEVRQLTKEFISASFNDHFKLLSIGQARLSGLLPLEQVPSEEMSVDLYEKLGITK